MQFVMSANLLGLPAISIPVSICSFFIYLLFISYTCDYLFCLYLFTFFNHILLVMFIVY